MYSGHALRSEVMHREVMRREVNRNVFAVSNFLQSMMD